LKNKKKIIAQSRLFFAVGIIIDAIVLHLVTLLTFYIRYFGEIHDANLNAYLSIFVPFIGIIILIGYFNNLYRVEKNISHIDIIYGALKTVTIGYFIVVTYIFYSRAFAFPRTVILISWFLNTLAVASWRMILKSVRTATKTSVGTLVLGVSEETELMGREFERYSSNEYMIKEYIDVDKFSGFENLLEKLEKKIIEEKINLLIISTEKLDRMEITRLFFRFNHMGVRIAIHPNLYEVLIGNIELKQIAGIPLLEIRIGERFPWYEILKQLVDVIASIIGLIITSPLILFCMIVIKLESKGPIFYLQERVGKNKNIFKILKFRTMKIDAETTSGPTLATEDDPRVTRLGKFLRRTHLDELPQFYNVLAGQMSLVGPRPERPFFVEQYEKNIVAYEMRTFVKPGITGLAQVHGRYDSSVENKLRYDLVYINNMSPLLDIKIIILTVKSLLTFRDKI